MKAPRKNAALPQGVRSPIPAHAEQLSSNATRTAARRRRPPTTVSLGSVAAALITLGLLAELVTRTFAQSSRQQTGNTASGRDATGATSSAQNEPPSKTTSSPRQDAGGGKLGGGSQGGEDATSENSGGEGSSPGTGAGVSGGAVSNSMPTQQPPEAKSTDVPDSDNQTRTITTALAGGGAGSGRNNGDNAGLGKMDRATGQPNAGQSIATRVPVTSTPTLTTISVTSVIIDANDNEVTTVVPYVFQPSPTAPNSTDSSDTAQSTSKDYITCGIVGATLLIAAIVGIWVFRKWKLKPSPRFDQKFEADYAYHTERTPESDTVFLRELKDP